MTETSQTGSSNTSGADQTNKTASDAGENIKNQTPQTGLPTSSGAASTNKPPNSTRPPGQILWGPVFISFALFLTASLLAFYLPKAVRDAEGQAWAKPIEAEKQRAPSLTSIEGPEGQKVRLGEQVQDIIGRAEHHFTVMLYFQSNYYVGILLRNIFAGLAALSLFLVSRRGWEQANPCVVSFFLTVSACAAFFIAFPDMFKQEENVTKNKALYLNYVALLNEVHTFVATGDYPQEEKKANRDKLSDTTVPATLSQFIKHLNDELKKSNDIAVAFDTGKFAIYKFATDK